MAEELIHFDLPVEGSSIIKVIGIGGGGSNAVNYMYERGIKDVNFLVCNTDAQALNNSPVSLRVQIGESITEGRGAGNKPDIGRQAALENLDDVMEPLMKNTKMVFITAGMGGGTGTGAAPVIAKACKEEGLLTVAIVTIPFKFEGQKRITQAITGINELRNYVDSILVINNEKLREVYGDLKLSEAFSKADDVLCKAAKGIAEIITVHGYINVDFADVETVMTSSGVAMMGSGESVGENRAHEAIKKAITSPLLNSNDITGARSILLNITSGTNNEISMDEVGEITDYINETAAEDVLMIWGTGVDDRLEDKISVTIIATGFEAHSIPELYQEEKSRQTVYLDDPPTLVPSSDGEFEVHDKHLGKYTVDEFSEDQRKIEFNLKPVELDITDDDFEVDEKKTADRMAKIKQHQNYLKNQGYLEDDKEDEIDELENQPAYVRKKISIDKPKYSASKKISKYSLYDDEEKGTRLSSDNSYLHDNVD